MDTIIINDLGNINTYLSNGVFAETNSRVIRIYSSYDYVSDISKDPNSLKLENEEISSSVRSFTISLKINNSIKYWKFRSDGHIYFGNTQIV